MHILGTHMHINTKYEVSILNPVARRAVHRRQRCRCWMTPTPDDNYARWTNHDYIGSFGRIPNEPKTEKCPITGQTPLSFWSLKLPYIAYVVTFYEPANQRLVFCNLVLGLCGLPGLGDW